MARRKPKLQQVPRSFVENVALIIGPFSAAQKILDSADASPGEVRFWLDRANDCFVLEQVQTEPEH